MKTYQIGVIPGDGSGPEMMQEAEKVLRTVASHYNFNVDFTSYPYGGAHYLKTGELLPDSAFDSFREKDGLLMGVLGHPDVSHPLVIREILLRIRFELDLYIHLRPVKLYTGIPSVLKSKGPAEIDLSIVRESSGGLYAGIGGSTLKSTPHEVTSESMVYTRHQVERCVRFAFRYAERRDNGKPVVLCGKTTVLTHVYDLWERVFNEVGEREFPHMKRAYHNIDEMCMLLLKCPELFNVIVTGNMFGDILGDLGAMLQGGVGIAAGGNINPEGTSMFGPIGGDFESAVWRGQHVNPLAAIQAVAMLLKNIGEDEASDRVKDAIMYVTATKLPGLEPNAVGYTTKEIGDMVVERI